MKISTLMKLLGPALLLWLLYSFDLTAIGDTLWSLPPTVLWKIILLNVLVSVCKFARWHILLFFNEIRLKIGKSLHLYAYGLFWGTVTPGKMGEFVKAYILKKYLGINVSTSMVLIIVDRLYDMEVLFTATIIGYVYLHDPNMMIWPLALFALVAGGYGINVTLSRTVAAGFWLIRQVRRRMKIPRITGSTFGTFAYGLFPSLAATISAFGVMVMIGMILAEEGYGLGFHPLEMAFLIGVINFSSILPVSLFGIGTNEVLILLAVRRFLPEWYFPEQLIAFSISYTLFAILPVIFISGLVLLYNRFAPGRDDGFQGIPPDAFRHAGKDSETAEAGFPMRPEKADP